MDSLTQAALGAAVGEAILGKKLGRKAAIAGAIVATIPDLDVLILPLFSDFERKCFKPNPVKLPKIIIK